MRNTLIDSGRLWGVNALAVTTVTLAEWELWLKLGVLAATIIYTVVKIILAIRKANKD